jgi:Holliday junction resolvasome RuvABC DNA-binding subunit
MWRATRARAPTHLWEHQRLEHVVQHVQLVIEQLLFEQFQQRYGFDPDSHRDVDLHLQLVVVLQREHQPALRA